MSQQAQEVGIAPSLKPSEADAPRSTQDHLQALRRRFEAAAEALISVHDQLKARGFQNGDCPDHRKHNGALDETEMDGGRP